MQMQKFSLVFIGFLLCLPGFIRADKAPSHPPREEVLNLVLTQLGAWATGDKEAFLETLHPDVVFAWPGKRLDLAGVTQAFDEWLEAFEGTTFQLHKAIIEGNNFAIEYRFSSTRRSNGKRHSTGTIAIGHIEDGKIRVIKEYLDGRVSRLQEAGELPVDEGEEPFPWPDTPESRVP
jgi:ketosteroid isomerase-like protein